MKLHRQAFCQGVRTDDGTVSSKEGISVERCRALLADPLFVEKGLDFSAGFQKVSKLNPHSEIEKKTHHGK